MRTTVWLDGEAILVPDWVTDLESFRRWSDDDDFPEHGQIAFLEGGVWIDISKEQILTHNQPKHEIAFVLIGIIRARSLGRWFPDGAFLTSEEGDISNKPDGVFATTESLRSRRVRIVEGRHEGHVELEGSPEMVLEMVSRSSVRKDTVVLREAYALAGVREYWLVDCRTDPLRFEILRLGRGGYTATRPRAGWTRSEVFGCSFRLARHESEDGYPAFTLETR